MAQANSQKDDHKKVVIEKNWDMKLGRWLANKGISYNIMAKWISEHTDVTVSPASLNQLVLHRKWPKRNKDKIIAAIELFCIQNGLCSESDSEQAFITDKNVKPITEGATWRAHFKQKGYIQALEEDVNGKLIFNLPEAQMLSQLAKKQFKLMTDPFENELSAYEQVFLGQNQRMVLEQMLMSARNGSMMALYSECGAGKSVIRNCLYEEVSRNHPNIKIIEPCRVDRSQINASTVSEAILRELNVPCRTISNEARDKLIKDTLTASYNDGNRHVLIVDEAHDLPDTVIKQLKRIWELADGFKKFIGIILIGQSEMEKKLKNHFVREFTYRCTQVTLPPLGNDLKPYIEFKLKSCHAVPENIIAGDAYPVLADTLKGIHRFGANTGKSDIIVDQSYPLNVNTLLKNCMNKAAELGETLITAEVIQLVREIH